MTEPRDVRLYLDDVLENLRYARCLALFGPDGTRLFHLAAAECAARATKFSVEEAHFEAPFDARIRF